MLFLIDNKLKIIFGWSAKCGCTHIKQIFWYLTTGHKKPILNNVSLDHKNDIIHNNSYNQLPINVSDYTIIIITRNPYERLVSGFLNKYRKDGSYRKFWTYPTLTFSRFVDEIYKQNWKMINRHHFTSQTSEGFNLMKIKSCKTLKLYDIKSIDYSYIECLYNKKIPIELINFRGNHQRKISKEIFDKPVYDLNMESYYNYNVPLKSFYSDSIKQKVFNFYKGDFMFFKNNGIDYITTSIV